VLWLEECSTVGAHGFPYLFRKGDPVLMDNCVGRPSPEPAYSWVDGPVIKVFSYYQPIERLNVIP